MEGLQLLQRPLGWSYIFHQAPKPLHTRHYHRCIAIYSSLRGEVVFDFHFHRNSDVHYYNTLRPRDLHPVTKIMKELG